MVIARERYVKAKIRSRIFNLGAVALVMIDILFMAHLFIDNLGNPTFLSTIFDPFSLGLLVLPLIAAGVLMFLSKRADKEMNAILEKYQKQAGK